MSFKLKLSGRVTIYQEDDNGNKIYICKNKDNHFTNAMVKGIYSYLLGSHLSVFSPSFSFHTFTTFSNGSYISLGSDTTTITDASTTGLTSDLGVLPTISARGIIDVTDNNDISFNISSTWAKNTISGNVGEIGLYMRPFTQTTYQWVLNTPNSYNYPQVLCARYAEADGNMTSFTIDTSKSLVVIWNIGVFYE